MSPENTAFQFSSDYILACPLDQLSPGARETKRFEAIQSLGLLGQVTLPCFDEALQIVSQVLRFPLGQVTLLVHEQAWVKAAVGLSILNFSHPLARQQPLPRQDTLASLVADSQAPVYSPNLATDPLFCPSVFHQYLGIQAYIGVPLITHSGQCIGCLEVLDLVPHPFLGHELALMSVTARWCMAEIERVALPNTLVTNASPSPVTEKTEFLAPLKLQLLYQLIQQTQPALTAVIGMSRVLANEVFGQLNTKQQEYLEIINHSGKTIHTLMAEILSLEAPVTASSHRQISLVDVGMLAQQVIAYLTAIAQQKQQSLQLSLASAQRVWPLDKHGIRQAFHYLMLSMLDTAEPNGEVHIHIWGDQPTLNATLWLTHPEIGAGLPHIHLPLTDAITIPVIPPIRREVNDPSRLSPEQALTIAQLKSFLAQDETLPDALSPHLLGLILGCYFLEEHGGHLFIEGDSQTGYKYLLQIPVMESSETSDP
ncbi:GAF domain-containing protein [Synechocystis sp. LKSZ1]|uniref:sensor histidine kinase n=1 Tax=Synechocystis sp. LKSZ1 TaxID=3144951 RepID=UPI00336BBF96